MRALTVVLWSILSAGPVWAAEVPPTCMDAAVTQYDMNACARSDFQAADAALNRVYKAVLNRHRDDPVLVRQLRQAQRAWIAWRDAEMKAVYPDREAGYYGSVFPLCWNGRLEQLTRERTRQLQVWLDGVVEGDVCSGSYPTAR